MFEAVAVLLLIFALLLIGVAVHTSAPGPAGYLPPEMEAEIARKHRKR